MFIDKRYKEIEKLYEWEKQKKVKNVVIQGNLPYMLVPFLEDKYKYIKIPMYAILKEESVRQNNYCLNFLVFGEYIEAITDVLIRDSKNVFHEKILPVMIDSNGNGSLEFELTSLVDLPPATYSIYLRFGNNAKINIRKLENHKLNYSFNELEFIFYTTIYSNVGLKINTNVNCNTTILN